MPTAQAPARAEEPTKALTIVDRVEQSPVVRMLDDRASALMELLPDQAAADRFRRVSVQAIVKNPDLLECTPESVILSIFEAAAQGLEPTGAAGGAHLVPYKVNVGTRQSPRYEKRAQLIPDYRGVIRLVTKPPSEVVSIEARVVKEDDVFEYELGLDPIIRHVPSKATDRSAKATTHVYAIARLRNGSTIPDVEDRAGIERIEKRGGNRGFSPWSTDWDEMAKKTIIKRLAKVLPVRPEIRSILVREDELAGTLDVDQPAGAQPAPATSRVQALGRQLKDVTPAEEAPEAGDELATDDADQEPAEDAQVRDLGVTTDELYAELERIRVSKDYAGQLARRLFPDNFPADGQPTKLSDEQRRELLDVLVEEQQTSGAL